jgi:antitoxin ParD1/3/4
MPTSRTIEITLPEDLDELVREKVASGAYPSASDVIHDGLRALQERESDIENWLETEGVARFDAHHADPSRELSADRVSEELRDHMKARSKGE